jgi:predicted hotdog family 3-hydroxylacyl-ACP dehydratase
MEQSENIENLIPQRPPFVMVDKLLNANENTAESAFTILEDNVLTDKGVFTEAGIIENIAQTSALHAGYMALKTRKATPKGMIGGIKNLHINLLPAINTTIKTSVSIEHEIMNAKIVKGHVFLDEKIIAKCEMKVFLV